MLSAVGIGKLCSKEGEASGCSQSQAILRTRWEHISSVE